MYILQKAFLSIDFLSLQYTAFMFFITHKPVQIINRPLVGWWVGFGCGWAKLNVLQKRLLVCRLAALLILRRVGIFVCRFNVSLLLPTKHRTFLFYFLCAEN
jgi:hypothetical protein